LIEQEIFIKTIERKIYKGQIQHIPQGTYEVSCTNSSLRFDKNFVSDNKNNGEFNFEHYSTKPEEVSAFLTFVNQKVGQLTYSLKVKVEEMPEIKF
jgi:hypothetical protein